MKLLLVTPEPVGADVIRQAVGDAAGDAEVMVVVPARETSPLRFWMSDVDTAIAEAESKQEQTVQSLSHAGISATGDTGEPEPGLAIQDALATFPADRVVVLSRADSPFDGDLEQRFGVPVTHVTLS